MTHPRRIIRDAVTAGLVAANTNAADRVFPNREAPVNVESMLIEQGPFVLVYTRDDKSPPSDGYSGAGEGWAKREVCLYIEATAAADWAADDKLDALAEQIEAVLDDFQVPDHPAIEIRHVETIIETTDAFEVPVGGALLEYKATYWRQWRTDGDGDDDTIMPCSADVGVKINGGPREAWPMCGCDD